VEIHVAEMTSVAESKLEQAGLSIVWPGSCICLRVQKAHTFKIE